MRVNGLIIIVFFYSLSVKATPIEEITQLLMTQEQAWNKGDIISYMDGYWQSDEFKFVSNNYILFGWQKTFDAYQKNYPNQPELGILTFTIKDIKILSPEAGLVLGLWQLERKKDQPKGVFTLLVEKIHDRWVITHDHTSG